MCVYIYICICICIYIYIYIYTYGYAQPPYSNEGLQRVRLEQNLNRRGVEFSCPQGVELPGNVESSNLSGDNLIKNTRIIVRNHYSQIPPRKVLYPGVKSTQNGPSWAIMG